MRQKDLENARHYANKMYLKIPNDTQTIKALGFLAERDGNWWFARTIYEQVETILRSLIISKPQPHLLQCLVGVHVSLARLHLKLNDVEQAYSYVKSAIFHDPTHVYAHKLLGFVESRKKNAELIKLHASTSFTSSSRSTAVNAKGDVPLFTVVPVVPAPAASPSVAVVQPKRRSRSKSPLPRSQRQARSRSRSPLLSQTLLEQKIQKTNTKAREFYEITNSLNAVLSRVPLPHNNEEKKDPKLWNAVEVGSWVIGLNAEYHPYHEIIVDNRVTGQLLCSLLTRPERDAQTILKEIGIATNHSDYILCQFRLRCDALV